MKLNLNFNLKDLGGKELEDSNAGQILAKQLAYSNKGEALKFWELSLKLFAGETVDLDTSDQNAILEFIKKSELPNLTKAQLELALNKK